MAMNVSKGTEDLAGAVGDAARTTAADLGASLGATGERIADKAGDVAASSREALDAMQRIMNDFAARTGQRVGDVAGAARTSGAETAERFGALARDLGRGGLDNVAGVVSKRPATALAVAAGLGLLLGVASRAGRRR